MYIVFSNLNNQLYYVLTYLKDGLVSLSGLINKNSHNFTSDSWKFLGYSVIGVCILEKLLRDIQGVFIVFGLWRNALFPPTVQHTRMFENRKRKLIPVGMLRRGLVNWGMYNN